MGFDSAISTKRYMERAGTTRGADLHSQVVEDLGQRIVDGSLPPDEIIFADQICDRLHISRSVVREGLRTLGSLGMVQSRPQRGTRVLPMSHWDLLSPYVIRWRGQGNDYIVQMRELLELRMGIERAAAYFATTRMDDAQVEDLSQAVRRMEVAFERHDTWEFFQADADLHGLLLTGVSNAVMSQFAGTVAAVLGLRAGAGARAYAPHGISQASVRRHVQLVEAIAARDRERSTDLAEQIILATIDEVEALAHFMSGPANA